MGVAVVVGAVVVGVAVAVAVAVAVVVVVVVVIYPLHHSQESQIWRRDLSKDTLVTVA